jgi:hypothetical protein
MTAAPPPSSSGTNGLPDWEDPRVQIVYKMLCDASLNEPPNPEEHWEGWISRNIVAALSPQAQAGETRPFYGAECPSYPACDGGCGLGCTKEIERSRHSAQDSQVPSININPLCDLQDMLEIRDFLADLVGGAELSNQSRDAAAGFVSILDVQFGEAWASSIPSTMRVCAKCGCKTKGEEALVSGEIWCHPCADGVAVTSTDGKST